jgi:nicotinamidase/pyrazinamidase
MDLSRTALVVVDMQKAFGNDNGDIPVADTEKVGSRLTDYLETEHPNYGVVVGSCEDHKPDDTNGGHITFNPDEVDYEKGVWPPHGFRGTEGARFVETFDDRFLDLIVYKGHGAPAASAFEGVTRDGHSLNDLLRAHRINALHVVGVAAEVCVKATAQSGRKHEYAVTLLWDLIAAVRGSEGLRETTLELSSDGIIAKSTDEIRKELANA